MRELADGQECDTKIPAAIMSRQFLFLISVDLDYGDFILSRII